MWPLIFSKVTHSELSTHYSVLGTQNQNYHFLTFLLDLFPRVEWNIVKVD